MESYRALLLVITTWLLHCTRVQPTEFLCSSQTSERFQVILLLNLHYGPECTQQNPRWQTPLLPPEVFTWQSTLQQRIGFKVVDTCSDPDIAAKVISENIPYTWTVADPSFGRANNSVCTANGNSPINIGFVSEVLPTGYDNGQGLINGADIPLVLTVDSSINSTNIHSNTVAAYSLQTTITYATRLMVKMNWDYVTVIYSDDVIGHKSLELFQNISHHHQICIDKSISITYNTELDISDIVTVGVVLLGSEGVVLHRLQQLTPSSNVWITFHDTHDVDIKDGVKVYSMVGESMSQRITNSLVSFSNALSLTENIPNCLSDDSGECVSTPGFRKSFSRKLLEQFDLRLWHTIDDKGVVTSTPRLHQLTSSVFYHDAEIIEVAEALSNGTIVTYSRFNPLSSLCLGDCRGKCGHFNIDEHTTYIHGEWVIIVFVPIHETADLNDQWSCTNFTTTRLFRTEAAVFAFETLVQKLNETRFGLLILDSCGYKLKPAGNLYDVIRGTRKICNHRNECFNPKSVVQVIADYSSAITQQLQTVTREMPVIQMAYGASSITLNDRKNYPYFLRTNPADNLQGHFMVALLKSFKTSKINAVNIIYTDGLYGRTGAEVVKENLAKEQICVHLERKVNVTAADNDFDQLVTDIIYSSGDVKITILFVDPEHINDLMDTVMKPAFKTAWLKMKVSFLLSDTWNDDPALLESYGDIMRGSFSFNFNSDFKTTSFTTHLKNISLPTIDDRNYWLSTLVQEVGKCKIRGNFHSTYNRECNSKDVKLTNLERESYSSHLMKAITATIYGLRAITLDEHKQFLFHPSTIKDRYRELLDVRIPQVLENKGPKNHNPFTEAGNGKVGYSIYNIKLEGTNKKPTYVLVQRTGSSVNDKLGTAQNLIAFYDGSNIPTASITSTIPKCVISTSNSTSLDNFGSHLSTPLIVISTLLGVLLTAIIIVIIVIVICYRKKWEQLKHSKEGERISMQVVDGKDEGYDEISYMHYMSEAQRANILRFVAANPGTAPPTYMLSSEYSKKSETEYKVPRNNQPISESLGLPNTAFSGSGESGTSTTTRSYASGSTLSASKFNNELVYEEGLSVRGGLCAVPIPAPRAATLCDTLSSSGTTYAVLTSPPSIPRDAGKGEEKEDMV